MALGTPAALQYSLTVRPSCTWVLSGLTWTLGPLPPKTELCESTSPGPPGPPPTLRAQPSPLTVHVEHGPGHVLPGAAVCAAQVLALIRGLNGWQAQDATMHLGFLRELATRAP